MVLKLAEQVRVQRRTSAVNVTLHAFAAERRRFITAPATQWFCFVHFLPARHYANELMPVCSSFRQKSEFRGNCGRDRAGFWHICLLRLILRPMRV